MCIRDRIMVGLDVQLPNHPPVEDDDPRTERTINMICQHSLVKHVLDNPAPQFVSKVCNRLIPVGQSDGLWAINVNLSLEVLQLCAHLQRNMKRPGDHLTHFLPSRLNPDPTPSVTARARPRCDLGSHSWIRSIDMSSCASFVNARLDQIGKRCIKIFSSERRLRRAPLSCNSTGRFCIKTSATGRFCIRTSATALLGSS